MIYAAEILDRNLEYLKYGPDAGLAYAENYNVSVKQGSPNKEDIDGPNLKWPNK